MLLTKEVEIGLSSQNIKRYESMGYHIPRIKDSQYRMVVRNGTTILVKVEDLPLSSNVIVMYQCDFCGKKLEINYRDYTKKKKDKGDACFHCARLEYASESANKTKLLTSRSFYQMCVDDDRLDLLFRWDYDKNNISPEEVLSMSSKRYFFKCENNIHDSEEARLCWLSNGGLKECFVCKSLGYNYGNVLCVWSDKNKNSPFDYLPHSTDIVFWKCENNSHFDYERKITDSTTSNFRCPKCVEEREESFLQGKVRKYFMSLGYFVLNEFSCNLRCVNPKTKNRLPYDNEIPEIRLIVEVHGKQHYKTGFWNILSEDNGLEYLQWKDSFKKEFALNSGYHYLEIPYTADDSSETYKQLIDDKIKQILSLSQ